jgi:hypothetical protein
LYRPKPPSTLPLIDFNSLFFLIIGIPPGLPSGQGTGGPAEKSFFTVRPRHPMAIFRFQAAWKAIFSLKSD